MYLLLALSYEALLLPILVSALEAWLAKEQRQVQEEKEELAHNLDLHINMDKKVKGDNIYRYSYG